MDDNTIKELIEKIDNISEKQDKYIDIMSDIIEREQDKNEITVKTIKEINKQYSIKEFAITALVMLILAIIYFF